MDLSIAAILAQDGITTGAIYALLALALVLVFSVTRVIFIPQGEFVSYGALTLAALQTQKFPLTSWLLVAMGVCTFIVETAGVLRHSERRKLAGRLVPVLAGKYLVFPIAVFFVVKALAPMTLPMLVQIAITLLLVVPMGPMLYRLAYQPLAEASTLLLLIVSVGVHFALTGLGLVMFGADEMHQAFNFEYLEAAWTAADQYAVISRSLAASGSVGAPTTWVLSNHDVLRHASRLGLPVGTRRPRGIGADDPQPDHVLGLRRARAATLLMLSLPGSAYLYQGEELGLPEHTTLPDEVRQDPTFLRTGGAEKGRDGCRVPIPWEADAPSYGFARTAASWLPQPASWAELALDRQRGVPGSTYELYRSALRLRAEHGLGGGSLTWTDATDDLLSFRNGDVYVVTNFGPGPVRLPAGVTPLLTSAPLDPDGRVPADVTVWAA